MFKSICQFTSDTVDRNSIDGIVNSEPEQQLVRGYEHGPGHQPHQQRRPGGEQVAARAHRHCRREAPVHALYTCTLVTMGVDRGRGGLP